MDKFNSLFNQIISENQLQDFAKISPEELAIPATEMDIPETDKSICEICSAVLDNTQNDDFSVEEGDYTYVHICLNCANKLAKDALKNGKTIEFINNNDFEVWEPCENCGEIYPLSEIHDTVCTICKRADDEQGGNF